MLLFDMKGGCNGSPFPDFIFAPAAAYSLKKQEQE
jgi:hypothetical protein